MKESGSAAGVSAPGRRELPDSIKIWKTISKMDPRNPSIPDDVKKLAGKEVSVVGFMIPNDAGAIDEVHEFLLTPMAGGCIHVPPPPANYVVHVTMGEGKKTKIPYGAIEVLGKILLPENPKDRQFYSFELHAYSVDNFNADAYMKY